MATAETIAPAKETDWSKPAAMAIPKEGYFTVEQGDMAQSSQGLPHATGFQSSPR